MQNEITTSEIVETSNAATMQIVAEAISPPTTTETSEPYTAAGFNVGRVIDHVRKTKQSKPATANTKAAAKRVSAKAETKPAKPTSAEREAARADKLDDMRLARTVAAGAIASYYSGTSLPFKAASDKFTPLNGASRQCKPSQRQAALLLALITYGAGNFKPDGSFVRGGFRVPAKLINPKLGDAIISAQPESGCIGDMRDLCISYSDGSASPDAVLKLNVPRSLTYIQAHFGDARANAAKAMLASYGVRAAIDKPAKPAKAA